MKKFLEVFVRSSRRTSGSILALSLTGAVAVDTLTHKAHAYSLSDVAVGWSSQLQNIGKAGIGGSFLFGLLTTATGLHKLKQYYDSQGRDAKLSEGWGRLGVGSALTAVPWVSGTGLSSLFVNGTASVPTEQTVTIN